MKTFSTSFAAAIAAESKTLCHAWIIRRADDVMIGLTDHDVAFSFDGVEFTPLLGAGGDAVRHVAGLDDVSAHLEGGLAIEGLNEADILDGKFAGARVELWMVDWTNIAARAHLRTGVIGEIVREGDQFKAEVFGLSHLLHAENGRVFARSCDANVGDARCGVDLDLPAYSGTGAVSSADGAGLVVTGLGAYADNWFEGGVLIALSGANAGKSFAVHSDVLSSGARAVRLWETPRLSFSAADSVKLQAGCDKRLETCRLKFSNYKNFRGFPHIPGNDFVMSYVGQGSVNDGASTR